VIAVDTNVLVRYLTNDDQAQAQRAYALLAGATRVFVAKTVLLETEWVLRRVYRLPPSAVLGGLRQIVGLPNTVVEAAEQVARALCTTWGRVWILPMDCIWPRALGPSPSTPSTGVSCGAPQNWG
jgi:predicted nucleic-acid-binding protein